MGELLTTKEIAQYLKLRPETVLRKVKQGDIPAVRVGGRFRFDKQQINEWLHSSSTSKKHILVIDDEEIKGHLFKDTLDSSKYQITTARSSTEALRLVGSRSFDLIFIDLKMPGVDGAETFRRIRQVDSTVPVVVITGYINSDFMERALEQGPFGIMRKPFNSSDIRRSVDSFLRGAKAKDKLTRGFEHLEYTYTEGAAGQNQSKLRMM